MLELALVLIVLALAWRRWPEAMRIEAPLTRPSPIRERMTPEPEQRVSLPATPAPPIVIYQQPRDVFIEQCVMVVERGNVVVLLADDQHAIAVAPPKTLRVS